jgi:CxxC-x17-CxxC domain-containing protein
MGNYDRDRNSSGGRNFGRRDFGGRDGSRPTMMLHKTTCSKCNKECEVPFRPSGSRPVYCRECFQTMRPEATRSDSNFPRRPNFENRSSQINRPIEQSSYKEQFGALNAKLDKILKILEPKVAVIDVLPVVKENIKVKEEIKKTKASKIKKVAKKLPASASSPAAATAGKSS